MTAIGRQFRLPNVLETFAEEEEGEDDILPEIQLNSPLTWNCSQKENPIIDLPELRRKDAPNESEYVPVSRRTPSFIGTAHVVDGTFNISRRSSHKAAIMASGGHRRRSTIAKLPFAIQAVPKLKTRARELWSILRKNVLAKKMSHPLGGYLSDLSKSVPYKQILKMGFHYQRSLKHDQTVLMVLSHAYSKSRPGAIGAEAMEQAYQLGIASGNEDTGTSGKTSKVTAIVTVNRTRQLSVWDTHSKKSKWSTTLSSDLKHLIFVSKHAVYAACFLDSHVLVGFV